jgi:hypothetical protein
MTNDGRGVLVQCLSKNVLLESFEGFLSGVSDIVETDGATEIPHCAMPFTIGKESAEIDINAPERLFEERCVVGLASSESERSYMVIGVCHLLTVGSQI